MEPSSFCGFEACPAPIFAYGVGRLTWCVGDEGGDGRLAGACGGDGGHGDGVGRLWDHVLDLQGRGSRGGGRDGQLQAGRWRQEGEQHRLWRLGEDCLGEAIVEGLSARGRGVRTRKVCCCCPIAFLASLLVMVTR